MHAHALIEPSPGLLRLALRGEFYDVSLADAGDGRPLGVIVLLDELTPDRLTAIERLWHALSGRRVPNDPRLTPQKRERARRMLRAVDARHAGVTYRAVAAYLFPAHEHDAKTWVESAIREATIRLVRDGMKMVRGGYRTLMRRPRRNR